jgi:mono/diheme cytochrome c family protein
MVGRPVVASKTLALCLSACLVVALVRCGSAGPQSDETINPATDMGAAGMDMANAARQYRLKCSVCHGTDGAPVLATAPDLRTSTMTVEERVAIIAYGKGTMPPHRGMLDMPTIRGIAVYIESFQD